MNKILIIICLWVALLSGCSKTEKASSQKMPAGGPLLIGLIPEQNLFRQFERYKPLARYLSKKTGVNIKLSVLPRYGNIINNFKSEKMDGALQDRKGKRFAFVDKASTAGYLLPRVYFHEHELDYKTFLQESYFTGTHEDAIYDILNRKADIGSAKNTVYARIAAADSRVKNELIVLERSPDVPENGLAVRRDLDDTIKQKLKEALLGMYRDPEAIALLKDFGAQKFIETAEKDYLPVYQYAREVPLDLSTYDYLNE